MKLEATGSTRSRLYHYDYKKDLVKQEASLVNLIYV